MVKGNLNSLADQGIEHTIGKTIKANKNWKNIGDRGSHQSLEKKKTYKQTIEVTLNLVLHHSCSLLLLIFLNESLDIELECKTIFHIEIQV